MILFYKVIVIFLITVSSSHADIDQRLVFERLYSSILDKPDPKSGDIVYELDFSRAAAEAENTGSVSEVRKPERSGGV